MIDAARLESDLVTMLRDERGDPTLEVRSFVRLSGGASRSTWSFEVTGADGLPEPCILQLQMTGGNMAGAGMDIEAALLRAAAAAGVAVAELLHSGGTASALGGPFIVSRLLTGEAIPRRILRDDRFAAARPKLAAQCGAALAGIHALDPAVAPDLDRSDRLVRFREVLDLLGDAHPTFELAFRWLDAHRPPTVEPTVVHGDFRLGNLLVDETGVVAVLDWELAHAGDPMEDLGWLCVRSWRFGGPEPVGGFGRREELFEAYERARGQSVDPTVVHWWEVFGTLAWGVMCIVQSRRHLDGHQQSVELATIGRRVAETEYDLLGLLGASLPDLDRPETVAADEDLSPLDAELLHDRPTAAELIAAVRGYLETQVLEVTTGSVRFHGQVAINALAIVERELLSGPEPGREHAARLATFGCTTDAELAAAIRTGDLDHRADLAPALLASVIDKLRVANPRWLHPDHRR